MNFNAILRPFRRLQDILTCVNLMRIFPKGLKNREKIITDVLKRTTGENEYSKEEVTVATEKMEEILPRYGDAPMIICKDYVEREVLDFIKESGANDVGLRNLFPPVDVCCGAVLHFRSSSKCTVFERNGGGIPGQLHTGTCKKCKTVYSLNSLKHGDSETYFNDILGQQYFMSTRDTVFETQLIYAVDRDMYRNGSAFEGISNAYNDVNFGEDWSVYSKVRVMDRRRLSEAWFKWHLIEMKIGLGERNIDTLVCSEVDAEIQRLLPRIHEHFTEKWSGSHHCDNCKSKDCSQALIIDGHMKGTRLVCDFMEGDICCEEIGSITVGCNQTPVKGSYFCVNHQHSLMKVNKIETQPDTDENQHSLQCKTEKRKQAANKHRSAGICCAVYSCGVVVGITELFGCESLSQVYVFLTWLWHAVQHFPRLFAYDDACHLKRYVNSRQKTAAGKFIANLTMVVDKMHFKNHVDKWCKQNVNPHKVKEFCDLNTEACEQTFKFVSQFKHATKHMTYASYNLFHLIMCNMYNEDKIIKSTKRIKLQSH